MAPFRSRDRSARSGRGHTEHNVLEGLPINQYREVEVTIGGNAHDKPAEEKDAGSELPMPAEFSLLPEHSQHILRAARAGKFLRNTLPPEEEKETEEDEEETTVKEVQTGFTIRKYAKVPRQLEEPEPEYLAKRRKGLPSQFAVRSVKEEPRPTSVPMRETKVKKVDADGNVSVYKVLVPHGQTLEGEVTEPDAEAIPAPAVAAPGTVVEGVGIVNADGIVVAGETVATPQRRRPPPPKKKAKGGPGRKKKKVVFEAGAEGAEGSAEGTTPAINTDTLGVPNIKPEAGSVGPSDVDTPMADAPDGEEEEGDEADEASEDEDHEDGEVSQVSHTPNVAQTTPPSKNSDTPVQEAKPIPEEPEDPTAAQTVVKSEQTSKRDPSSSPELPLATAIAHSRQNSLNQIPVLAPEVVSADAAPSEPLPPAVEAVANDPVANDPVDAPVEPVVQDPVDAPVAAASQEPLQEAIAVPQGTVADPVIEQLPQKTPESPVHEVQFPDGDTDLLGSFERQLEANSKVVQIP